MSNKRGAMPQRMHTNSPFYGCVDADGVWFDSSMIFSTAVHWCCCAAGECDLEPQQEIDWMTEDGRRLGYSVVHSDMLRKMWDAGVLK